MAALPAVGSLAVGCLSRFLLTRQFAQNESPATRVIHNVTEACVCFFAHAWNNSGVNRRYGSKQEEWREKYDNLTSTGVLLTRIAAVIVASLVTRVTHGQSMRLISAVAINLGTCAAELSANYLISRATGTRFKPIFMI